MNGIALSDGPGGNWLVAPLKVAMNISISHRCHRPFVWFCSLALAAALGGIVDISVAGAGAASFQGLGDLPGGIFSSRAEAVSGDGMTVVGSSRSSTSSSSHEAFRWTQAEGMVALGDLVGGAPKSIAFSVSQDGGVIVGQGSGGPWNRRPFRWTQVTGLVALDDSAQGFFGGQAFDVSADGSVVVGVGITNSANEGFRWTPATGMAGLGFLDSDSDDSFAFNVSDNGAIVCGLSNAGMSGVQATRWTGETGLVSLGDVPGGVDYAIAYGISGDGQVIAGVARATVTTDEAFLWTEQDGFTLLDPEHGAAFSTSIQTLDGDGSHGGGYHGATGALSWDAANGLRDLKTVLQTEHGLDLGEWILSSVEGISDDGLVLVGSGRNPSGAFEAWIARLPSTVNVEPDFAVGADRRLAAIITAYPNPARGDVRFSLQGGGRDVAPRIEVIGVDGRCVLSLLPRVGTPTTWTWNGRDSRGDIAMSGVYTVRVDIDGEVLSRSFVRIR